MRISTEALKRAMGRKFLNGRKLAAEIGVSANAAYKILRGDNQPSVETLQKMCRVLEVDPDEIVEEW